MSDAVLSDMMTELFGDLPQTSWHEDVRRDLGIPDECAEEAMLTLVMHRVGRTGIARPIAFVINAGQSENTLLAVSEFLREAFHPASSHGEVLAVIDFLPPLDGFGASAGISRRWVLDRSNLTLLLPQMAAYVTILSRA